MPKKGTVCAVAECPTSSMSNNDLSYHRFPMDPTLRKKWIANTKRVDEFNPSTSRICSRHFSPDDYERDFRNELFGRPSRSILKPGAVPTLNLEPSMVRSAQNSRSLKINPEKVSAPSRISSITISDDELSENEDDPCTDAQQVSPQTISSTSTEASGDEYARLKREVKELRAQLKRSAENSTVASHKVVLMEKHVVKLSKTQGFSNKQEVVKNIASNLSRKKILKDVSEDILKKSHKLSVFIQMRYVLTRQKKMTTVKLEDSNKKSR